MDFDDKNVKCFSRPLTQAEVQALFEVGPTDRPFTLSNGKFEYTDTLRYRLKLLWGRLTARIDRLPNGGWQFRPCWFAFWKKW